ncbi:MAG: FtsX-like permease family protein [Desulfobacterales bacterium]
MIIDIVMGWRNIWRNPRRTILTIMAIAFACTLLVFMLSFQFGSYETMINASVKINTGHLQVQAVGYHEKNDIHLVVSDPSAVARSLSGIPDISAYTFRASGFALASSAQRTYGILVMGIDPEREAQVSTLKKLIRRGRYLSDVHTDDETVPALVGKMLAQNLRVRIGDELTLLGQGRDGSIAAALVTVAGIYSSGIQEFDRSAIHIPLDHFQEIFSMRGAVHAVVILCDALSDVESVERTIENRIHDKAFEFPLVVLDWDEMMPGLRQGIKLDLISGLITYLLLIIVVAFSILNTFLMAILERTREFGVLMAIGTSPGRLMRLLLIESAAITVLGIVIGILLGILVTWYFQIHGLYFSGADEILSQFGISGRIYPKLSLLSIVTGPAMVFVITIFSALYPALKVRRLRVVEALAHA